MLKKWLPSVIKLALTAALFFYLAGKIDFAAAWNEAKQIDLSMLAAAILALLLQVPIGGFRWAAVTRAIRAEFSVIGADLLDRLILQSGDALGGGGRCHPHVDEPTCRPVHVGGDQQCCP